MPDRNYVAKVLENIVVYTTNGNIVAKLLTTNIFRYCSVFIVVVLIINFIVLQNTSM